MSKLNIAALTQIGATLYPEAKKSAATATALDTPQGLSTLDQALYDRTYASVLAATGDPLKATLAAYGAVGRARYGLAVKSQKADGKLLIKGWGVLFGSPVHRDLDKTWFGRDTAYLLDFYQNAPLWKEHGDEASTRWHPVGRRTSTEVYPEHGIFVVHELDPALPIYQEQPGLFDVLTTEIDNGEYVLSGDTIYHYMIHGYRRDTGELLAWPLAGFALVRKPAEPGLGPVVIERSV